MDCLELAAQEKKKEVQLISHSSKMTAAKKGGREGKKKKGEEFPFHFLYRREKRRWPSTQCW